MPREVLKKLSENRVDEKYDYAPLSTKLRAFKEEMPEIRRMLDKYDKEHGTKFMKEFNDTVGKSITAFFVKVEADYFGNRYED